MKIKKKLTVTKCTINLYSWLFNFNSIYQSHTLVVLRMKPTASTYTREYM